MARIRVKLSNGQTGTIDENEFDSSSMQRVDAGQQQPQAPVQQPQSTASNVGSKTIDFLKGLTKPVVRFGESLGQAAGLQSKDAKAQKSSEQALFKQINRLQSKAAALNKKGKTKEAKRLLSLAQEQSAFLQKGAEDKIQTAQEGTEDVIKGAVGTGSFFVPGGKSPLSRILASGVAGGAGGFGVSEKGEELESTVGGAVIGGAIGIGSELLGAVGSKLTKGRLGKGKTGVKISGAKIKKDPFFASTKEAFEATANDIGITPKTSSKQATEIIEGAFKTSQSQIDDLLRNSEGISDDVINKNLAKHFENSNIDPKSPGGKKLLNLVTNKLNKASGNNVALNQLKSTARGEMGNAFSKGGENLTQKQEVWAMVHKTLKDSLDTVSPEIRKINTSQHNLFGLADEFSPKAVKEITQKVGIKIPFTSGAEIPTPVSQQGFQRGAESLGGGVRSILGAPGRGLEAAGQLATQTPQAGKNVLINQLLQGGQQPQAQPQQDVQSQLGASTQQGGLPPPPQTPQQPPAQQQGFGKVDINMVNMAQLMLEPKEANKIISIYERQQKQVKDKAVDNSKQIILDQLDDMEKMLADPKLSKGRVGGKYEQIQSALGLDPRLKALKQSLTIAAPIIGKNILQLGRLTDEDIRLAMDTLPSETLTPVENATRIKKLRKLLNSSFSEAKDTTEMDMLEELLGSAPL